jgi:predicted Ser/Thr protein kinase
LGLAAEQDPQDRTLEQPEASRLGQRFGDYELLELIGRGGMGKVYRARQVSLNRIVALKLIHAGRFAGPQEVARFRQEAEAAAALDHPNIAHIYEVGQREDQHYFTMKFVEGQTLSEWNSRCPERDKHWCRAVAKLVAVVARALHHAHKRGVMHRDLKPGNILLDQQGEPFIVDFGLALLVDRSLDHQRPEGVLGTLAYMAPEQLAGSAKDLTTAVDIYSLGCILYELLTGRLPDRMKLLGEGVREVGGAEVSSPRTLNRYVDNDLVSICLKCLRKRPEERYDSAAALAEDLERWLRGQPVAARPVGPATRIAKWTKRHPLKAGASITVLGAAGAVFAISHLRSALHGPAFLTPPKVSSVEPLVAAAGSRVTITGADFSPDPSANLVSFPGEVRATLTQASSNRLTVMVPAGTKFGSITVTVRGRTGWSPKAFVPTFAGSSSLDSHSFEPRLTLPVPLRAGWLLLEDLDGDGKLEVCAMNYEAETELCMFRNISSPGALTTNSFTTRLDIYEKGQFAANAAAAGDLVGNGKPDLIMPSSSGALRIAKNMGQPGKLAANSFSWPFSIPAGGCAALVRDLDGDGRPDLVVYGYPASAISIIRNVHDSWPLRASSFAHQMALNTGQLVAGTVVLEDIDGDGRPDLILGSSHSVQVFRNVCTNGTLDPKSFADPVGFEGPRDINSLLVGDIDGDGKPDIIVGTYQTEVFSVFRNTSIPGRIDADSLAFPTNFPCGFRACRMALGDLDGDGKLDLAIPLEEDNAVSVFINRSVPGRLGFAPPVNFATDRSPLVAAIADLDGDGRPDLVTANYSGSISIFRNALGTNSPAKPFGPDR